MFGPSAQDLKARVDLRDVVRACWGQPQRQRPRYDVYASRWRDDGKRPAFTVYTTHFKDYGGEGAAGDVFAFLMLDLRCDFKAAVDWLAHYLGEGEQHRTITRQASPIQTSYAEPPPAAWQQAATQTLEQTQRYLWSKRPDAQRALNYLREQRGLSDASIKAAGYGYNPRWQKTRWIDPDTGKPASLAPGIIEPWWTDGALWALRVRCRVGELATALHIAEDHLGDSVSPKYLNLSGSKQSGALYQGDRIQPGSDLLMVEGGFDAVLAAQHLDMPVVTLGSATNRPTGRRLAQLQQASRIFLLLDHDDAGQAAAQNLRDTLGSDVILVTLPAIDGVKDITDFIVKHGGNLATLLQQAQQRAWWPGGLPDAVRSALLTYFRPSTAPVLELVNRAVNGGYLNPNSFTINDLIDADAALGERAVGISPHSIRRVVNELTDYAFLIVDEAEEDHTEPGRRAVHYKLTDLAAIKEMITLWAAPRIYEKCHPISGDMATVARPTPAMMVTLGYDLDDAHIVSAKLDEALSPAYFQQDHAQDVRNAAAYKALGRLRNDLENTDSSPLPTGWPLSNPTEYRAAFLRATNDQDERRSRRSIQNLLGVANGSVDKMVRQAGLEKAIAEGEFTYVPLNAAHNAEKQIRAGARSVKGFPRTLVSTRNDGETVEITYTGAGSIPFIAAEMRQGAQVSVRYQIANRYVAVTAAPVAVSKPQTPFPAEPPPPPPRYVNPPKPRDPFMPKVYGPHYNPAWVREQLKLALFTSGRLDYSPYPHIVDTLTGEVIANDELVGISAHALLRILLPDTPLPGNLDDVPDVWLVMWHEISHMLAHKYGI